MKFIEKVKNEFSLISILLIPVAIAINFVGFQIAQALKLPMYLDSIGTMLVGLIAGPWVGAATGLLTNLINGVFNPVYFAFTPIAILIGVLAGLFSKYKMMTNPIKIGTSIVIMTLILTVAQAPIIVYAFGGATGTGSAAITAAFLASGKKIWESVFSSTIIVELADKGISLITAFLIAKSMSSRYLSKFKYGEQYIRKSQKTNIDDIV